MRKQGENVLCGGGGGERERAPHRSAESTAATRSSYFSESKRPIVATCRRTRARVTIDQSRPRALQTCKKHHLIYSHRAPSTIFSSKMLPHQVVEARHVAAESHRREEGLDLQLQLREAAQALQVGLYPIITSQYSSTALYQVSYYIR